MTYLDHAGTTPYARSLIDGFSSSMLSSLFGNPHSASPSSQLSMRKIDATRLRVLRFFQADPNEFDVVFVTNATAGVKLVLELFRDCEDYGSTESPKGFWYGYHYESHTSLIGVREAAGAGQRCFESDAEVVAWLSGAEPVGEDHKGGTGLFSYPAQSNMTGRRLPLDWCGRLRRSQRPGSRKYYSLLDAAALVSTAPLDLSDAAQAPDFTVLSFYKIFGFPDLGALILRKACQSLVQKRRYFGGGTVNGVVCLKEQWHAKKTGSLHELLEDGTLPVHSIVALDSALDVHEKLYGDMLNISRHTSYLAKYLHDTLSALYHSNGQRVCDIYKNSDLHYEDCAGQGPVIAFNMRDEKGNWVANSEVEKLASIRNIHLRTGGLCNPGGVASFLHISPGEAKLNFSEGQRCGTEFETTSLKPTGAIRVSLGAMSNKNDVDIFLKFVVEFFATPRLNIVPKSLDIRQTNPMNTRFYVKTLTVYPIKSCGGWNVPLGKEWEVMDEGLAWDRAWCLVHLGNGAALSQKSYPKMALIRPSLDLDAGVLRIHTHCSGSDHESTPNEIEIPLLAHVANIPSQRAAHGLRNQPSRVCGEAVVVQTYISEEISQFFTSAVGVSCTLARFPAGGFGPSRRHSKIRPQSNNGRSAYTNKDSDRQVSSPILLSNESPVLMISQSSLELLNTQIEASGEQRIQTEAFRANIVIDEHRSRTQQAQPYIEDSWDHIMVRQHKFQVNDSLYREA